MQYVHPCVHPALYSCSSVDLYLEYPGTFMGTKFSTFDTWAVPLDTAVVKVQHVSDEHHNKYKHSHRSKFRTSLERSTRVQCIFIISANLCATRIA